MIGNKDAYEAAYQRALHGKSSRPWWNLISVMFEDEFTRESREKGEHDGRAAREAAQAEQTAQLN